MIKSLNCQNNNAVCFICGKNVGKYGTLCKRHKKSKLIKKGSFIW
jgi:ribosomal protein S4E